MKTETAVIPKQIFTVDYAGIFCMSDEDSYSGKDLLDAEDVGYEQAKANANEIIKRFNMHNEAMDIILTFIRESKSDTKTVLWAQDLLNRDKE